MNYISFVWDNYLIWVKHPKAEKIIEVSDEDFHRVTLGCTIDKNGVITETEEYQENLHKQQIEKEKEKVTKVASMYEVVSLFRDLWKVLYKDVLTTTQREKFPTELKDRFQELNAKIDALDS